MVVTGSFRQPALYRVFVDELGYTILSLLQYRSDTSPAQLLPTCLTIFSSLRLALGPCVGVVTEWFVKQVYIKTILQVASVFTGEKLSSVGHLSLCGTSAKS